jgi:hypothetical protein
MDIAAFVCRHRDDVAGESQKCAFWSDLAETLHSVYKLKINYNKIDFFVPGLVLIEHKTRGKLDFKINGKNAIDQAKRHYHALSDDIKPKWIITCDFATFRIYDDTFSLVAEFEQEDLADNLGYFDFFCDPDAQLQLATNIDAAEMMGKLHDVLRKAGYVGRELEIYITRIMVCLFAEDIGIFERNQFADYVRVSRDVSARLHTLFSVLDRSHRATTIPEELRRFRYINGNLFHESLPILYLTDDVRYILLECTNMDWSRVSPAIFGTMFQSVMDEKNRRNLGAHYTSETNILKLIKPLFLDALWKEFGRLKKNKTELSVFHEKLRNLKFLDPACGCGNFLVITYRELRKLEFEVIKAIGGQIHADSCGVNVDQFYGIEIDEWPAQIATISLWLMDHLMNLEFHRISGIFHNRIPLIIDANIYNENALRMEWPEGMDYIMGNPPYVGGKFWNKDQQTDMKQFSVRSIGHTDYIAAWFIIASRYMIGSMQTKTAFVTTKSINQGRQVYPLWKPLFDLGIHINFVVSLFKWLNEAKIVASVLVNIVGFSLCKTEPHFNAYLKQAPNLWIKSISNPICNVPLMYRAAGTYDNNIYVLGEEEKKAFIEIEPAAVNYIYEYLSGSDFLKGKKRYILCLNYCPDNELECMPNCQDKVDAVKYYRTRAGSTARCFRNIPKSINIVVPLSKYLVIPATSSENYRYIPMGFVDGGIIPSRAVFTLPHATEYHFGVLTSAMHMVWVREVCGRLECRYRYSSSIVYNNFMWPRNRNESEIIDVAVRVLDIRNSYLENNKNFAWLYNPKTMPDDLKIAHEMLDAAVDAAYGLVNPTDDERFSLLCKLHNEEIWR